MDKKLPGRPKKPKKDHKKAITFKFRPVLLQALDDKAAGRNKTAMVESVLEREFLGI